MLWDGRKQGIKLFIKLVFFKWRVKRAGIEQFIE